MINAKEPIVLKTLIVLFASATVLLVFSTYYLLSAQSTALPASGYVKSIYGSSNASLLAKPMGVATDKKGRIYVADTQNRRVQVYESDGSLVARFPRERDHVRLSVPLYIAVNSRGEVYVSDRGLDKILVFNGKGHFMRELKPKAKASKYFVWSPVGITFDEHDNLYVTDFAYHRVLVISPAGEVLSSFGALGVKPGQFAFANGIAVHAGRVYVADSNNGRIEVFTSRGKLLKTYAVGSLPRGIAIDRSGRLFVVDTVQHSVKVLRAEDGRYTSTMGREGAGEGEFMFPNGIALDERFVYVADTENNRIQIWGH